MLPVLSLPQVLSCLHALPTRSSRHLWSLRRHASHPQQLQQKSLGETSSWVACNGTSHSLRAEGFF